MTKAVLHVCDVSQGAYRIVFGPLKKIVIVFKGKSEGQRKRGFDLRKENLFSQVRQTSIHDWSHEFQIFREHCFLKCAFKGVLREYA